MPEEIRGSEEPLDRPESLLIQAPTPICVTRGPAHRVEIMNPAFEAMAGVRDGGGRLFRDICPGFDVESQLSLMDRAFGCDERLTATEVAMWPPPASSPSPPGGTRESFFNLFYEPLHDGAGAVDGLMISGVEVTAHVAGRRDLELAQQHARFLVDASAALSESLDYARTLRRVAELAVPHIADWCTVSAIDEHGVLRRLAVVHRDPARAPLVEEYERRFPPMQHRAGELAAALASDRALLRERVTDAELIEAAQSPDHLRIMRGLGCASCIIAPMIARGEPMGIVSLMRSDPGRPYTAADVAVAEELSHRAALAVDNARLYRGARRREQTMRFFADASAVLSSSLDYEAAFDKLAQLVVPTFADWCAIDVTEGDGLRQVTVAHANPAKVELARELRQRYPPDPRAPQGVFQVIRTGKSELYADIPPELLARSARDEEHLRAALALGLRSALVVPLAGRGAPIGALTLVWAESDHRYGEDDLRVMEELGRRAGFALENARLYGETQSAVRLRDEFISIASHELKTPLTSMQLQISGIRRAAASPARLDVDKLARRVDAIDKQVGRLTELVDGLLDVSRAAAGRLHLNVEDVDLTEVVRTVAERFTDELAVARSVLELDAQGPILGRWDRLRVDDIVTNLLGNAIKYGAGRPIRLAAREEPEPGAGSGAGGGRLAVIEVQDHGIGIQPHDHQRIFQRFARAVSSEHYGGFGLGLWIVHVLVQAMGGSVEVDSVVGEGAVFTVRLPCQVQNHESTSRL
jgi:signal transduction histidine kinase